MKSLLIALTAATALVSTSGAASARIGVFGHDVPGYLMLRADVNNDGVLNRFEMRRANSLARMQRHQR